MKADRERLYRHARAIGEASAMDREHAAWAALMPPRPGYTCGPHAETNGGGCFNCGWAPGRDAAATLAERMNARPLGDDVDGGEWSALTIARRALGGPAEPDTCETCGRLLALGDKCVASAGNTLLVLCLPCAAKDCARAEAEHRAADPHCTCPDCIAHHAEGVKP